MASLPLQNNSNFNYGPYSQTQNVLNVQPVIPFHVTEDWNVISRTILPVINQVGFSPLDQGSYGLGDLNPSLFLSPSQPSELIWGVGPAFLLPTGTSRTLGTGKWSIGPTAVALTIQGDWLIGVLANNLWSVAGPWDRTRVSQFWRSLSLTIIFRMGPTLPRAQSSPPIGWRAPASNGSSRSAAALARYSNLKARRSMPRCRPSTTLCDQMMVRNGSFALS